MEQENLRHGIVLSGRRIRRATVTLGGRGRADAAHSVRTRVSESLPATGDGDNGLTLTDHPLAIYLRDHHAAGSAGRRLAARAAKNVSPEVEGRDELARVAKEIDADLKRLEAIMRSEGVTPSTVKDTLAGFLEVLGRLKLNGRILSRSPLSDVIELEALLVGITGKAALWRTLDTATTGHEIDALTERAQAQIDVVSRCRDSAVLNTFSGAASGEVRASIASKRSTAREETADE